MNYHSYLVLMISSSFDYLNDFLGALIVLEDPFILLSPFSCAAVEFSPYSWMRPISSTGKHLPWRSSYLTNRAIHPLLKWILRQCHTWVEYVYNYYEQNILLIIFRPQSILSGGSLTLRPQNINVLFWESGFIHYVTYDDDVDDEVDDDVIMWENLPNIKHFIQKLWPFADPLFRIEIRSVVFFHHFDSVQILFMS